MGRWILAIDLGNGGPKVAVVDLHDQLLAVSVRAVSVKIGLDGTATQDANEWWKETLQGAREAIVTSNVNPQDMHAVAITGQWGSTVPWIPKEFPLAKYFSGRTPAVKDICAKSLVVLLVIKDLRLIA